VQFANCSETFDQRRSLCPGNTDVTGDVRNPVRQVVRRQLISIHREETMKTRLENQIAIVTGSSSGNGRAIALTLSSAGATVICADSNKKARKEGYEEDIEIDTDDVIQHRGGKAVYVQADVRYASEVESLVTRTVSEFGRITPRNKGGTDEIGNLQALCFSLARLFLLEGKIGYFLGEIARRGV